MVISRNQQQPERDRYGDVNRNVAEHGNQLQQDRQQDCANYRRGISDLYEKKRGPNSEEHTLHIIVVVIVGDRRRTLGPNDSGFFRVGGGRPATLAESAVSVEK